MHAVKFIDSDTIEGRAIPFGGPFAGKDFDGEDFGPDTDFCLDWFGETGRPVLYDHGLDGAVKSSVIGRQVGFEVRDDGVWVRAQLNRASQYRKVVDHLIQEGALGFSSGAMPHLTAKNTDGHITRWPWVELSLTPTPANPDAIVYAVKATDAIAHLDAAHVDVPDALKAALTALDDWAETRDAPPAGESSADHGARVLGEVKAWVERARTITEMRAQKGRTSAATRARVLSIYEVLAPLVTEMKQLLEDSDPAAEKSLHVAMLEAQKTLARLNGVPV